MGSATMTSQTWRMTWPTCGRPAVTSGESYAFCVVNNFFTSRRLSHRLVSVKNKIKKVTFAFWFGSFIICLVLNSDLAC